MPIFTEPTRPKPPYTQDNPPLQPEQTTLSRRGQAYGIYGLLLLSLIGRLRDGASLKAEDRKALEEAQRQIWDLEKEPLEGFSHRYWHEEGWKGVVDDAPAEQGECSDKEGGKKTGGVVLHYVERTRTLVNPKGTIVFVHGFPNAWHLYSKQLVSPHFSAYNIISVDLPGHGGSASLPAHRAYNQATLFPLFYSFLKYVAPEGCTIVAHDWGALLFSAFVSVPEYKDHIQGIVLINGVIPNLAVKAIKRRISDAKKDLKKGKFIKATKTLLPVIEQSIKSSYVFTFGLPIPIQRKIFPKEFYACTLVSAARRMEPDRKQAMDGCATSLGPLPGTPAHKLCSDPERSENLFGRMNYYRQNLFPELTRIEDVNEGKGGVRRLFIWGKRDMALSEKLAVERIPEKEVAFMEGGHWPMYGKNAEELAKLIGLFVDRGNAVEVEAGVVGGEEGDGTTIAIAPAE